MTTQSRLVFLIALLGSACVFEVETAQAEKPGTNFSTIAPAAAQIKVAS